MDETPSIQERLFPDMTCFGCGPANAKGLRIRSFPDADGAVRAVFRPWPEHDNGLGNLNGGIITTLLDCHAGAAAILESEARELIVEGRLQFVTAGIDVRYRRPAPLAEPVELVARATSASDDELTIEAELWWQDKVRASGVSHWKRWRPR